MDEVFWGCLCGIALPGIIATLLLAAIFTLGRDREPRERHEVQKGARWP